MHTPVDAELPNLTRQDIWGDDLLLGVSHAPAQGAGPWPSQFWGFFLFMHTPFVAELPNLTW